MPGGGVPAVDPPAGAGELYWPQALQYTSLGVSTLPQRWHNRADGYIEDIQNPLKYCMVMCKHKVPHNAFAEYLIFTASCLLVISDQLRIPRVAPLLVHRYILPDCVNFLTNVNLFMYWKLAGKRFGPS